MALVVVGAGAFAWATTPVPSLQASALVATTTVYYADGETVMGELNNGGIDRKPLESDQMPAVAKQAAVASEDRTFFQNKGVSITGLGRAVWGVVTGNPNLGGGSTITQQYVKNITGNDQRAYTRKATEAIQALKVDQAYDKDEILTSYLNTVYFGRGAYGIGAAAEAYFGQPDASQLTAPQAALLIGILPAPSAWDPATSPESAANAQKRYSYVMGAMQEMGSISAADVAANPTMPETVVQEKPKWQTGTNGYLLQTVVDEVKGIGGTGLTVELVDGSRKTLTTGDDVASAGLRIVSTIDKPKQDAAVAAVDDQDNFPTRNRPDTVRAGLVSIDPATGGVVAMYGGPDISNPAYAYNAVTQASAQAGSTFKPITLLAALSDEGEGITLSSTYSGKSPQTFAGTPVSNFDNAQYGTINLVQATAKSVNTAYMELNEEIGPETTAKTAEQLGITMDDSAKSAVSNVLGSSSVKPIQMAQAYAALANGGTVRKAHFVKEVSGGDNTYFLEGRKEDTQPFKAQAVADTVYAMQAVTKTGGTAPAVGKAFGNRPIAGKTGTTNQNRAAWFNGFTPQLQATVVLFNPGPAPDYEEQPLGSWGGVKQVTGGTFPSKIWTAYMKDALDGTDVEQFPKPSKQVSASPSPTATATPTPTETATADPSESPSEGTEPTDGGDGQDQPGENGDGGDGQQGDEPAVAAGPAGGVLERAAGRAAAVAQGGPGQGRGGGQQAPPAGPGRG